MRPYSALCSLVTAVSLCHRPNSVEAQETAPIVLRVPASPRAFGMGDAFAAGAGSDAVFYNPAQIGRTTGIFATASRYSGASTQAALASSTALGRWTFAAFAQWLDYGSAGFPSRIGDLTVEGPNQARSLSAGLSLATRIKGFRVGVAGKYVEERLPHLRDGTPAFDIGISRGEDSRVMIALVAQHIGSDIELGAAEAKLPTRVTLGATSRRVPIGTFFDLAASAALSREREGRIVPGAGAELTYEPVGGWTTAIRIGARRPPHDGRPSPHPLTVGASFGLDRLTVDYGFERYRGTGAVHRFGLRIQ